MNAPESVAIGPDGSVYIADTGNQRIRRVTSDGKIATVAGGGSSTQPGIRATSFGLSEPTGIAAGPDGAFYVVDSSEARVLRVATDGTIALLAGTGTGGFSGDNGAATRAQLNGPTKAALGRDGNLYLVDRGNNRVRRITLAVTPTVSTLTLISGNNQTANPGAVFGQPLVVQASDSTGALAAGAVVTFALQSGSAILSSARVTTGVDGRASINVQGGPVPGPVAITASTGTLSATFNLTVASVPPLTVSTTQVSFSATSGGPAPAPQQLIVSSAGTPVPLSVQATSAGNWLKAALSATISPATLTITADPTGLNIGAYTGTVAINSPSASNSPLTVQVSLNVTAPASVKITISTVPAGLSVLVDGGAVTTPMDFNWVTGATHTLDLPTPQALGPGTRYTFDHWSQGGVKAQTLTVPAAPSTYTAVLTAQYLLSASANPPSGGALNVSPVSPDGFYSDSAQVRLTASAASGYTLANFSGDATGTTNPQVITMSAPRSVVANFTANAVNTTVTISSNPSGRVIFVDGLPVTAPQDFNWSPGSMHTLDVQTPQGVGFTRYAFDQWSNGGARSQTIRTPSAATTYTASFIAQQLLTITASPSNGGSVTANPPSADGFYNQGAATQLTAVPAAGFTFAAFSGDLTGSANPQSISVTAPKSVSANFTAVVPLTVNPAQLSLTAAQGANAAATVQVDGGTPGQTVTVEMDQTWLRVSPSQGVTPFAVNVVAASASLAAGSYRGNVTVGGTKSIALNFQVTAPVTSAQLVTDALAAGLQFNLFQNAPPPGTQRITLSSSDGSVLNYIANVNYPSGTRAWVSLSARTGQTPGPLDVGVQVTALGVPGVYTAVLVLSANGSPDVQVPLTLSYTTPPPSAIQVDVQDLKLFSTGDVQNTSVVVKNTGPAVLSFNVISQPDDPNSGNWLRVNPANSSAIVQQPSVLQVTADPTGLATGTYTGAIQITANQQTQTVRVVLAVNSAPGTKMLRTAINGLSLRVGNSYTDFPPQTLDLLAYGKSSVSWTAQADASWIQLTPANGVAQPGTTAGSPQVKFNLAQLQAGSNKGAITIQSDSVGGDLVIPVEVQLLPAGVPVNRLEPVGLVFVPPFNPRTDVVYVPSVSSPKLNISSNQPAWLTVEDTTSGVGTVVHKLRVTVDRSRLPAGTPQSGLISIQEPNGVYAALSVLAYLPDSTSGTNRTARTRNSSEGATAACVPGQYIPLATSFFQNFEQTGGAATTTEIAMIDDCGNPVSTGVMGGVLGNGDPQLNLLPLGDGRWKTTWNPTAANSFVTLSIIGADPDRSINPTAPVQAASSITGAPSGPVLAKDQPFETEAGVRLRAIAPNLQFRIRGQNLLNADGSAPKVLIGGRQTVVVNATATRIVVLTPADLTVNTESQVVIQRSDSTSVPEIVIVARTAIQ